VLPKIRRAAQNGGCTLAPAANLTPASHFSGTLGKLGHFSPRRGNGQLTLSSARRAWIAVAAFVVLLAAGIGAYLRHVRRNSSTLASASGSPTYSASPQQKQQALELLNELPGDAPGVAYIDVEALRKLQTSPLAALLGLTGATPSEDEEYRRFVRETGFDYARDLDRAAISIWFNDAGEKRHGASQENQVFVVADGRFNQQKIENYARKSGSAVRKAARTIYIAPERPPVSFEFLSPTRIAIASGTGSAELLAGPQRGGRDAPLQARIDRVAGAPLLAVVRTDHLPEDVYAGLRGSPQIETLAESVRSLTLTAQPQGDALEIAVDGESDSEKNALAISTLLEISRMGASVAMSNSPSSAQMNAGQTAFLDGILRGARIRHDDRWVRVAFQVTPQMLRLGDPGSDGKGKGHRGAQGKQTH
jgi:hypothetical protein